MLKYTFVRPFEQVLKEPEKLDYETRITEDSYVSIEDQVNRFMAAGMPLKGSESFDYPEGMSDDGSIVASSIYGGDPVDIQNQLNATQVFYNEKLKELEKTEVVSTTPATEPETKTES